MGQPVNLIVFNLSNSAHPLKYFAFAAVVSALCGCSAFASSVSTIVVILDQDECVKRWYRERWDTR